MSTPEIKRLAAEVTALHGIRVDPDDPMMAVVTLNRLVLEAAAAGIVDRIQQALRSFEDSSERLHLRLGGAIAKEVRACTGTLREEMAKCPAAKSPPRSCLAVSLLLAFVLFIAGVCVGRILG